MAVRASLVQRYLVRQQIEKLKLGASCTQIIYLHSALIVWNVECCPFRLLDFSVKAELMRDQGVVLKVVLWLIMESFFS